MPSNLEHLFWPLMHCPRHTGKYAISIAARVGNFAFFLVEIARSCFSRQFYFMQFAYHLSDLFIRSLFIVAFASFFTGAVLAMQSYSGLMRLNADAAIPTLVAISITRELGPVLAGLISAGRIAGSIAAEIGGMTISNQVSAMYMLSVNPLSFLIVPRILAGIISVFLLAAVADIVGMFGGYVICVHVFHFSDVVYINNAMLFLVYSDVISGLVKAAVFGLIVSSLGSYYGYTAKHSAHEIGRAVTGAVVMSFAIILVANYLLTALLL